MASIVPRLGHLSTLILEGRSAPDHMASSFSALAGLKHLHLRHRMTNTALAGLAGSSFTLTSLTLTLGDVSLLDLHTTLGTFASSLQRLQLVVDSIPPTAARPDPLTFPHLSELWLRGHCASLIALFDACPALRILHAVTPNVIDAFDGSHFLDALRELRTRRSLPSLSSVKFRIVPIYVSTFDEIGIRSRFDGQLYDDIEEERKALGQVWGTMRDVEVQIEQDYDLCPCLIRHDACWDRWAGCRPEED